MLSGAQQGIGCSLISGLACRPITGLRALLEYAGNVLISVSRLKRKAKPRFGFSRRDLLCHHLFITLCNLSALLYLNSRMDR
jgi:hypothetical protein